MTITAAILTHIVSAIIQAIKTKEEPEIADIKDERDTLIDLSEQKKDVPRLCQGEIG